MNEERRREVLNLMRKNEDISIHYQLLMADIANKLVGKPRDNNQTIKESYNIYLRGIIKYPELFPENVQDIIIEKAKLEPKEIIECYIDEVEKSVESRDGEYMSLQYMLGEIWLYKLENIKYQ